MDYSRFFFFLLGICMKLTLESFYADNMLGKKWKPHYFTVQEEPNSPVGSDPSQQLEPVEALPKKKSKKKQELSTKGIP